MKGGVTYAAKYSAGKIETKIPKIAELIVDVITE